MRRRAVAITWAPAGFGDLDREVADAAGAAWMSTRWPACTLAVSTSVCQAVSAGQRQRRGVHVVERVAACGRTGATARSRTRRRRRLGAGTTACRRPRRRPAKRVTPPPTRSTTPDTSQPRTGGRQERRRAPPTRVFQSTGLTPAACTRTRTSVGIGSGVGRSTGSRTSRRPEARDLDGFHALNHPQRGLTLHTTLNQPQRGLTPLTALNHPQRGLTLHTTLNQPQRGLTLHTTLNQPQRGLTPLTAHRVRDRGRAGQDLEGLADRVRGVQRRREHRRHVVARDLAEAAEPFGDVDRARARVVGQAARAHDRVVEPGFAQCVVGLRLGRQVGAEAARACSGWSAPMLDTIT